MGGLALKNTHTRRYERAEFDVISEELLHTIRQTFMNVTMPLFYKNKKSFGDADILVANLDGKNMREYIVDTFHPNEIFHNGNCYSFDYKELQVDIISVSTKEEFDTNKMYLSYNDLGNFIGRIAQGFGMKYGQEGLWYEHYFKNMNIGRIPVSTDYKTIFKFLGLSYDRWEQGFDELEDIFEYIATSPFFNWEMFQLKNLNKINRERNLKRKSYMSFLEWMDKNVADANHLYQFDKSQEVYNDMIAEAFPEANLEMEIRKLEYEYCKILYIKSKFNGGEVMRKYGFQGKELGDILTGFKVYIVEQYEISDAIVGRITTPNAYDVFMMNNDKIEIYKFFDTYLQLKKELS